MISTLMPPLLLLLLLVICEYVKSSPTLHKTEVRVNMYLFHKDETMGSGIPRHIKVGYQALHLIQLPVIHSSLQLGPVEYNFQGSARWHMVPEWFERGAPLSHSPISISQYDDKAPKESIHFCNLTMTHQEIKKVLNDYLRANIYDVLESNCNHAAFDVANRLCLIQDPLFETIEQPRFVTRLPRLANKVVACTGRCFGKIKGRSYSDSSSDRKEYYYDSD